MGNKVSEENNQQKAKVIGDTFLGSNDLKIHAQTECIDHTAVAIYEYCEPDFSIKMAPIALSYQQGERWQHKGHSAGCAGS